MQGAGGKKIDPRNQPKARKQRKSLKKRKTSNERVNSLGLLAMHTRRAEDRVGGKGS